MAIAAREGELQASVRTAQEYPIRFTRDALAPENADLLECVRRRERFGWHRILFVVDADAAARCAVQAPAYVAAHKGSLALAAPVLVASGDALKRLTEAAGWLRARIAAAELGGRGHVVAIGGEALQQAAGFAAATVRPQPRLSRVPTTAAGQIGWAAGTESALEACGPGARCAADIAPFAVLEDRLWLESAAEPDRSRALTEAARLALAEDAALFHWLCESSAELARGQTEALTCAVRWAARLALNAPSGFGLWSRGVLPPAAALGFDCLLSRACGLPPAAALAALELLGSLGMRIWETGVGRSSRAAAELAQALPPEGLSLLGGVGIIQAGIQIDEAAVASAASELRRSQKGGVRK